MAKMKELQPYAARDKCPKCECGANKETYCQKDEGTNTEQEYLHIRCGNCGYEWDVETADAKT